MSYPGSYLRSPLLRKEGASRGRAKVRAWVRGCNTDETCDVIMGADWDQIFYGIGQETGVSLNCH